jgi:hypothetical protein
MPACVLIVACSRQKPALPVVDLPRSPSSAGADASVNAAVRDDGFYVARSNDTSQWLRFYTDGTVVAASSTIEATTADVARWLRKDAGGYIGSGSYEIHGVEIRFSDSSTSGTVHYTGRIEGTRLSLRWHSTINGAEGGAIYEFAPCEPPTCAR